MLANVASTAAAWEYITLRSAASLRMESNVLRLPDGVNGAAPDGSQSRSDVIRTYSAGASLDLPLSRQRLLLSYDINRTEYAKFSNLDFKGDNRQAILRWELGRFATGDAGITQSTNQTDIADTVDRRSNVRKTSRRLVTISYPFHAWWRLNGGLDRTDSINSDPVNRISDSTTDAASLELRYQPGGGNYVGMRASQSEAEFPNPSVIAGIPVDSGYSQQNLAIVAAYAPSGASNLQLAVGQTRRIPNESLQSSSTGVTGSLGLNWAPTGRTTANVNASRDFAPAEDLQTNRTIVDTVKLGAGWNATARIVLRGDLNYQQREYSLTPGPLAQSVPLRADITRQAILTLIYAAHERILLTLSARREQRESNFPGVDYTAGIASATAQIRF